MNIFLTYPTMENLSGSRELILMTGINKFSYYITMYLYDLTICFTLSLFMFVVLSDPYDTFKLDTLGLFFLMSTFETTDMWIYSGALYAVLFTYFPAMLTAIYVLSFIFGSNASAFVYFLMFHLSSCEYSPFVEYSVFDKSVSGKTLALEPIDKKIQRELVERLFAQNAFDR
jgi:hypothetical protein